MDLPGYNFHWRSQYHYDYPIHRSVFADAFGAMEGRRMLVLTGARRTGKTTIMRQMMERLIGSGVLRDRILYFSFDEERPSVKDIVREYETILGVELAMSKEVFYIFLDEVQKLDDWPSKLKYIYDQYPNVRIALSGSASLFVKRGMRESLAGRVREMTVGALSFGEFLDFRGRSELAGKPEMFRDALKTEFERYVTRQFVETVDADDAEVRDYARSIVEKVLYIDIPAVHGAEDPEVLMGLFRLVASNPGMLVDYTSISRNLGSGSPVSRLRVSRYLQHLQDAYIMTLAFNHSGSAAASQRKLRRAYLANTSMNSLADARPDMGRLVEQTMFIQLGARAFWRSPQKDEVDIVLNGGSKPLPVEVKYQSRIDRSDMTGLLKFMRKYGSKRGVLVSKDSEGAVETDEGAITIIPAWKAALAGISDGGRGGMGKLKDALETAQVSEELLDNIGNASRRLRKEKVRIPSL